MKKHIKHYIILFLLHTLNYSYSQTTIDYSTFSSSNCNIFGNGPTQNDVLHQTTYGQPTFNTGNKSVQLAYYGSLNKGTEYKIAYNFQQNYTYKITITLRNATTSSNPAGIKVSIGDNGSSNNCDGTEIITNVNGISNLTGDISSTIFNINELYFNVPLSASSNYFRISSYKQGESGANPAYQVIEIKKIVIEEIPLPANFTITPQILNINCG